MDSILPKTGRTFNAIPYPDIVIARQWVKSGVITEEDYAESYWESADNGFKEKVVRKKR